MNDIESAVFTAIAGSLRKQFTGISISSEYEKSPSKFPYVCITEQDNYSSIDHSDTGDEKEYSTVMYEISVYSNKSSGKKSECRKIATVADSIFQRLNFRRISLTPVPNMENATIYRLVGRYRAETDGKNLYRRN